jgi:hypothetical protein
MAGNAPVHEHTIWWETKQSSVFACRYEKHIAEEELEKLTSQQELERKQAAMAAQVADATGTAQEAAAAPEEG